MALVIKDRIKETATTTGTGTFTLGGAVSGFQAFSEIGNGNTTYYCIEHATENEFEVGLGTYTLSGTTLARTTIITSSNAGNAVNFSAGDKNVFVTVPATKTIKKDASDSANITSSDVTSALGFTPISSADGGNAATLDSLDSTSFLRSDATDTFTGNSLFFLNTTHWQVSSSDTANQRADARDDGTNFSRLHWYGVQDSGATSNFRHAWYDGSAYINLTVASGQVAFGGKVNVGTSSTLNSTGSLNIYRSDGNPYIGWYAQSTTRGAYMQYNSSDYFYFGDVSYSQTVGSFRAPIFYDSNDTNYSVNPASTSYFAYLGRRAHQTGHLVGGHNNIGSTATASSPIYTIGSSYNPNQSSLGNMYGIGYSHTNASFIGFAGSAGWGMYVAADGDARVYLSGQSGTGHFTGNITAYASDERLKTNIKPVENALDKVCQLRGVEFDWVDNITSEYDFHPQTMHETGVIAQNVAEHIPDAVCEAPMNGNYTAKSGTDHKFLTVDKEKIIPALIEAIKELKAEVDDLKRRIEDINGSRIT